MTEPFVIEARRPLALLRAVGLAAGLSLLVSCATVREDPVLCGVIGSVIGIAGGAALGTAVSDGGDAGAGIFGGAIGGTIGGYGGYKICKNPSFESAKPDE